MLGLFAKILPANDKYLVLNSYKLMTSIQMHLYEKQKTFCEFFSAFLNSSLSFEHFEKKDDPHRFCISEMMNSKNLLR